MFAALYGQLAVHPWRGAGAASDAYSLFVARSSGLGWLADSGDEATGCGLWGMNDAAQEEDDRDPTRFAWFQVSLREPVSSARPLPVQAFLSCAGDVVARIGTPQLRALQVLLPVHALHAPRRADAVMALLEEAGWFADGNPKLRTEVTVTLDGGQDASVRSAAAGMLEWMRGLKQDVFTWDAFPLRDDVEARLPPAVIDELWIGPPQHRAVFRGMLTEWSLGALSWLAALLADASSRYGVTTPVMLTASRVRQDAPAPNRLGTHPGTP
jgi:hypothetical protein